MKTSIQCLVWMLLVGGSLALAPAAIGAVSVALGPVYNPANGSRYYRITGGDWNQLRSFALGLGGDFATIEDASENTWVRANVVGNASKPFIGLNDIATEGTLVWTSGSTSAYRKWRAGEPANTASKDCVRIDGTPEGTWDIVALTQSSDAIVEVSGPLNVPGEFASLDAALVAVGSMNAKGIKVAPGTYNLAQTRSLTGLKLQGAGAALTRIQGLVSTSSPSFVLNAGSSVEGIDFIGRSGNQPLIAIDNLTSKPVAFTNCTFRSLLAPDNAELLELVSGPCTFERCEFYDTAYLLSANGYESIVFTAVNCIFREMRGFVWSAGGGPTFRLVNSVVTRFTDTDGIFCSIFTNDFVNSIIWGNASVLPEALGGYQSTATNCVLQSPIDGVDNQIADPLFVNPSANNFRVKPQSPAIDAGLASGFLSAAPSDLVDADGNFRFVDVPSVPNIGAGALPIDIGAYELAAATCPADFNHDSQVDDADFVAFLAAYNELLCP